MPVRARTYDPRHGRWLQRDPTGYADGLNLYEAFGGNATAFTDPMGTEAGERREFLGQPPAGKKDRVGRRARQVDERTRYGAYQWKRDYFFRTGVSPEGVPQGACPSVNCYWDATVGGWRQCPQYVEDSSPSRTLHAGQVGGVQPICEAMPRVCDAMVWAGALPGGDLVDVGHAALHYATGDTRGAYVYAGAATFGTAIMLWSKAAEGSIRPLASLSDEAAGAAETGIKGASGKQLLLFDDLYDDAVEEAIHGHHTKGCSRHCAACAATSPRNRWPQGIRFGLRVICSRGLSDCL